MAKQYRKLIILIIILLAFPYPVWYCVNHYTAGLVDQTQLIEFGMQEDFVYCQEWRPELFDDDACNFSEKVDIWSAGCLIVEVFSKKRPNDRLKKNIKSFLN